jgi:hypothetical protein
MEDKNITHFFLRSGFFILLGISGLTFGADRKSLPDTNNRSIPSITFSFPAPTPLY